MPFRQQPTINPTPSFEVACKIEVACKTFSYLDWTMLQTGEQSFCLLMPTDNREREKP
jgi:hypothetical protein